MFTVIQIAIGLSFIFLLFSLVVSAANELLLAVWGKRAEFLKLGVNRLLQASVDPSVARQFWKHPLIVSLTRKTDGVPSYLDARTFSLALLNLANSGDLQNPQNTKPLSVVDVESLLKVIGNQDLRRALEALAPSSGRLEELAPRIEEWFNQAMDRVQGWYKRFAHYCIFGISVAFAAGLNIDSVRMIRALGADPKMRENISQAAVEYLRENATPPAADTGSNPDLGTASQPALPEPARQVVERVDNAIQAVGGLTVPIGWEPVEQDYVRKHWPLALLGWLLTAFAGSMGAPFWFDTLNRVVNVRAAGRSPDEPRKISAKREVTEVKVEAEE